MGVADPCWWLSWCVLPALLVWILVRWFLEEGE